MMSLNPSIDSCFHDRSIPCSGPAQVINNSIITTGSNTDGCDRDSSWNVYIAQNHFSTGDDCIAIKSGRDWSGNAAKE